MVLRPIKITLEKSKYTIIAAHWTLKHFISKKYLTRKSYYWNKMPIFWRSKDISIVLKEVKCKETRPIPYTIKRF